MSTVILHTSQGLSNNLRPFLKNFMILENARVEFHYFPGFPGLLLIYPNIILIHVINVAILLYYQTKQHTAMSNKHCNFTVILFEQLILFLTLFRKITKSTFLELVITFFVTKKASFTINTWCPSFRCIVRFWSWIVQDLLTKKGKSFVRNAIILSIWCIMYNDCTWSLLKRIVVAYFSKVPIINVRCYCLNSRSVDSFDK